MHIEIPEGMEAYVKQKARLAGFEYVVDYLIHLVRMDEAERHEANVEQAPEGVSSAGDCDAERRALLASR